MFGMTKKQFLKRSKISMNEIGSYALLIRALIEHEKDGKINHKEVYKELMFIMEGISKEFSRFESLQPPSECVPLKLKILRCHILLQESVTANYDYVSLSRKDDEKNRDSMLNESINALEQFRDEFRPLTHKIDQYLSPKKHDE